MGAKDDTERVLRDLHYMVLRAPSLHNSREQAVINRSEVLSQLARLGECMEAMMEEYELLQTARAQSQRQLRREAEETVEDARRKAEDVYAASILFTDQALESIKEQLDTVMTELTGVYRSTQMALEQKQEQYRENQMQLQEQLQDMLDSRKYMLLIEAENRRLARSAESAEGLADPGAAAPVEMTEAAAAEGEAKKADGPQIIVNPEYFRKKQEAEAKARKAGAAGTDQKAEPPAEAGDQGVSEEEDGAPAREISEAEAEAMAKALSADLDAEYFSWQDET